MEHVRWHSDARPDRPVMVVAFTGWNDAGDASSTAVRTLIEGWDAKLLVSVDAEEFTDFATIRPSVRLTDGLTREIVWPQVAAWHASTPGGEVILVLGPEPSLRWRLFTEQLIGIAQRFDARMLVSLGALLADVPHTRTVQVIGTAGDHELIDRFDLQRSRYEGPTGMVGVLQDAANRAGLPAASLWAATPAYASQVGSPKAAMALLRRVCGIIGAPAPVGLLADQVEEYERQVDDLVDNDPELSGYVRRLELIADTDDDDEDDQDDTVGGEAGGAVLSPDHDTLIEELEQFLRDQNGPNDPA